MDPLHPAFPLESIWNRTVIFSLSHVVSFAAAPLRTEESVSLMFYLISCL